MKRVVLLFNALRPGGSQTYAAELASQLAERGYEVEILAKNGVARELFLNKNLKISTISWYENLNDESLRILVLVKKFVSRILLLRIKLRFCIRKPSLLIASQPWPIYYSTIISPKQIPIYPLIHGFTEVEFPPVHYESIRSRLSTHFCVSIETNKLLQEQYAVDSRVIGNLFSAKRYWGTESAYLIPREIIPNLIVIVSTLTSNKISIIFDLLKVVSQESSFKLRIVGAGNETSRIHNEIQRLCLNDRIQIMNPGMNPRPHFEIANLVIAVGRTALEASSRGIPVLIAGEGKLFGLLTSQNFKTAQNANFTARAEGSQKITTQSLTQVIKTGCSQIKSKDLIEVGQMASNVGDIETLISLIK